MGRGHTLLLGVCLLASAPAMAGTIYRCDTADGGRSYVSKRVPGAKCTVASSYTSSRQPSVQAAPAAAGSAAPANTVAGSPASIHSGAPATFFTPASAPAGSAPTVAVAAPAAPAPVPVTVASRGPRLVQGQVYSYIKDGVRHYTSAPPRGVANASAVRTIRYSFMETCYACGVNPGVNFGNVRLNTAAFQAEISSAAREFGVEESIVRAIIHAESAYNPNALSRVGAQGLMQLMPATARRFGVGNAFDPGQNIRGGVQYLGWLLRRFNGNLTLAAAGYNAGEGAVDKYKGVPPYNETQRYVVRVAQLAERYRGATVAR
ncbi:lytic transglycosylase domain-containing protein [Montanilutibacter psychrotolerans]|uniref:Lytic transglycosylase domain-containing protein n=1 Tax=Montanilutibacter psychrotolerans TaxID=1327343 RepID=A0A3M8T4M2_9GAMM|nr:lytic transglycosylase domain-containing protein [Lysobacter psychrotolerans]RNF86150.1 lytic transglycosylase domain-containing protein [Lysobacter psychrotolerans]